MQKFKKKRNNYIKDLYMISREWIKDTVLIACIYHQKELFLKWWGRPLAAIRNKICGLIKVLKRRRKMKEFSKFNKHKLQFKIMNDLINNVIKNYFYF